MTALVWDAPGQRAYQAGIDRGVLYLHDGRAVVWNGLTGMDESTDSEYSAYWVDGIKFLENLSPGEFSGKLRAWTYPDELDQLLGIVDVAPGLRFHEQPSRSFNLSYRTKQGTDLEQDNAYRIHLLYNVIANPDSYTFKTYTSSSLEPSEFSWTITGTPPVIGGYRPTVHVSIDSSDTSPGALQAIEDILYGTSSNAPRLPSIAELKSIFESLGSLIITDNGDGTWTAIDLAGDYITMDSPTSFTIENADADYLDATTYEISTTNP